jgi:hypothetical protein
MMTTITATLAPFGALYQRWLATPPAPKAGRSAAEEAADVRALADQYRRSDPGFASDLYAAADRHEREHEAV